MKQNRQEKIIQIINENAIETQEQLIDRLNSEGYNVTQATVSRDIRELRLTKISCGFGVYKYVLSDKKPHSHSVKYLNILKETVVGVEHAGNLVVIKTYAGMAQAAAAALDSMNWTEIIGTIAGDDTIFLALRSVETGRTLTSELNELLDL